MSAAEIVLFESSDGEVTLPVEVDVAKNEVWLTQEQMALLFDTTKQNVGGDLKNCFAEGELDRNSVVKDSFTTASDGKSYRVMRYSLDAILSVGYRVKSQRGVEFRRWANEVLWRYLVDGYAVNERRLRELGRMASIDKRGNKLLEGEVLVALTIMMAENRPQEKRSWSTTP